MSEDEERDDSLYGLPQRSAKPIYRAPDECTLFDFGVEHDEDYTPIAPAFSDAEFDQIVSAVPEEHRHLRRLPDRQPIRPD